LNGARTIARLAGCLSVVGLPVTTTSAHAQRGVIILCPIYKSSAHPAIASKHTLRIFHAYRRAQEYLRRRWVLDQLSANSKAATRFKGAHDDRE